MSLLGWIKEERTARIWFEVVQSVGASRGSGAVGRCWLEETMERGKKRLRLRSRHKRKHQ